MAAASGTPAAIRLPRADRPTGYSIPGPAPVPAPIPDKQLQARLRADEAARQAAYRLRARRLIPSSAKRW
ncbi:MAG: hypothetical protein H7Z21_07230 [Hymenobacter sp.]|nr:hypothetical protein [Hymenobacter sp.]